MTFYVTSGFPVALLHRYTLYGKDPIHQHLFFIACGLSIGYWNYGNSLQRYLNLRRIKKSDACTIVPFHTKNDMHVFSLFADYHILHSSTAICGTYLILMILGNTGLFVIMTFLFNMSYLLYGKAMLTLRQCQEFML